MITITKVSTLHEMIRMLRVIGTAKDKQIAALNKRIAVKDKQIALMELQLSGKPYTMACINGRVTRRR